MPSRKGHVLSGEQKEGAVAVMLPDEDKGKARGTEDDRKVKTQEGRAGDGWVSSFFLDKNVPYISEHHTPTQNEADEGWPKAKSF